MSLNEFRKAYIDLNSGLGYNDYRVDDNHHKCIVCDTIYEVGCDSERSKQSKTCSVECSNVARDIRNSLQDEVLYAYIEYLSGFDWFVGKSRWSYETKRYGYSKQYEATTTMDIAESSVMIDGVIPLMNPTSPVVSYFKTSPDFLVINHKIKRAGYGAGFVGDMFNITDLIYSPQLISPHGSVRMLDAGNGTFYLDLPSNNKWSNANILAREFAGYVNSQQLRITHSDPLDISSYVKEVLNDSELSDDEIKLIYEDIFYDEYEDYSADNSHIPYDWSSMEDGDFIIESEFINPSFPDYRATEEAIDILNTEYVFPMEQQYRLLSELAGLCQNRVCGVISYDNFVDEVNMIAECIDEDFDEYINFILDNPFDWDGDESVVFDIYTDVISEMNANIPARFRNFDTGFGRDNEDHIVEESFVNYSEEYLPAFSSLLLNEESFNDGFSLTFSDGQLVG